jgi:formylglycine-generating enzyme required for sulfatase activity
MALPRRIRGFATAGGVAVYVSYIEAQAYARWRGWRLPTEAEWQHASLRSAAADSYRDNFGFAKWNPAPFSQ